MSDDEDYFINFKITPNNNTNTAINEEPEPEIEETKPTKKGGKHKKEMTAERRQKLLEQLARGREKSKQKRAEMKEKRQKEETRIREVKNLKVDKLIEIDEIKEELKTLRQNLKNEDNNIVINELKEEIKNLKDLLKQQKEKPSIKEEEIPNKNLTPDTTPINKNLKIDRDSEIKQNLSVNLDKPKYNISSDKLERFKNSRFSHLLS